MIYSVSYMATFHSREQAERRIEFRRRLHAHRQRDARTLPEAVRDRSRERLGIDAKPVLEVNGHANGRKTVAKR